MKPDSAIAIVRKLRGRGHEAYFVGGCVRDMVMGIEPTDYDIATSAHPEEIMQLFPHTVAIGAQFGVILVIYYGHPFEVATFRSDLDYVDGRRPTGVVFTHAQQDVLRRDFTINGLLYDPLEDRIIDYVNGQADIRSKLVRAIGDPIRRFEEDKLRVLRAVRFGARFGYSIDPATWDAVRMMAPQIHQVSNERIREEITRIMTEGNAARGARMLEESGLWKEILSEVEWTQHLDRSLHMVMAGAEADFATGVLLHTTPLPAVKAIVERLKFSRSEMHHIVALVENLPRSLKAREMTTSGLKRFFRMARFENHIELARIYSVVSGTGGADYAFLRRKFEDWGEQDIAPPPLISGEDLIELGYLPGPRFKEILARVEDEQLEGHLASRDQAVQFVKSRYGVSD